MCGFIDFGFQVDDRFYSITAASWVVDSNNLTTTPIAQACGDKSCGFFGIFQLTPSRVGIATMDHNANYVNAQVYLIVY